MTHLTRSQQKEMGFKKRRKRRRDRKPRPYTRPSNEVEKYIQSLNEGWKYDDKKR